MNNKKKSLNKKSSLSISKDEFNKENFIEGAIVRPITQLLAFISFIAALFLLIKGDLKWGGSLVLFSFILNMDSIYKSLLDKRSVYRSLNLFFKLLLFIIEIIIFNYILTQI